MQLSYHFVYHSLDYDGLQGLISTLQQLQEYVDRDQSRRVEEEWRSGGEVEEWRRGGVEEWRSGGVEEWRSGGVEEAKEAP